jgi:hypothetical protein
MYNVLPILIEVLSDLTGFFIDLYFSGTTHGSWINVRDINPSENKTSKTTAYAFVLFVFIIPPIFKLYYS